MRTLWAAFLVPCLLALAACSGAPTSPHADVDAGELAEDDAAAPRSGIANDPLNDASAEAAPGVDICPAAVVSYPIGTRCEVEGTGSIQCPGAPVVSGWTYACADEGGSPRMPTGAGVCRLMGRREDRGTTYSMLLCDVPSCARAAQFDTRCAAGATAIACPPDEAASGVSPPACTSMGSWGDGLSSGPLYCCP